MRYLVTGGTGFVGRVLVRQLVARYGSENVVCLIPPEDNHLERTGRAVLQSLNVRTICADVRNWQPLPGEIPEFDILFHLAASTDSGALDHSSNDKGTDHLLHILQGHLPGTRVVYASTTAVIDRRGPADAPLSEASPCHPKTEYGRSKLRAEQVIRANQSAFGYTYTVLRFSTVYGFGTRTKGLFDLFSKWVRNGHILGRINWPGKTSLVFVDDVARIAIAFAEEAAAENETYCLVTESPSIGEIARSMARVLNMPVEPLDLPEWMWKILRKCVRMPGLFSVLPGRLHNHFWRLSLIVDHGLWCSGAKMRQLYVQPLVPLEEGIKVVLGIGPPGGRKAHVA